jgi:hypothetical protein
LLCFSAFFSSYFVQQTHQTAPHSSWDTWVTHHESHMGYTPRPSTIRQSTTSFHLHTLLTQLSTRNTQHTADNKQTTNKSHLQNFSGYTATHTYTPWTQIPS